MIHGPPGIGKTSHALEMAYSKQENEVWRSLWFRAETSGKFKKDLQAIYKLIRPNDTKPTFIDMIMLLKNELKKGKEENLNFLIVLDNLIEDKDDKWVDEFLALMPENVFILITSRNSNVLSNLKTIKEISQSLEVKYFTKEQGEEFFKENIKK